MVFDKSFYFSCIDFSVVHCLSTNNSIEEKAIQNKIHTFAEYLNVILNHFPVISELKVTDNCKTF